MSTASLGRAREHKVKHALAKHGWRPIMRAAGSKGSADLLMVHAIHGGALIQVGSESKTLGPADRARLVADATDCGHLALLAVVVPRQPIRYWQVVNGLPKSWPVWTPEDGAA